MIRAMHMNPEVQFLDVAANMNSLKHEMFFAVVKGATGQTFIVDATVMPCGQGWIFLKIYETFSSISTEKLQSNVYNLSSQMTIPAHTVHWRT